MAEASDTIGMVCQNLKDAGCDSQTTEQCMSIIRNGDYRGLMTILISYRKTLLNSVRLGQKQIDCLDYLIYKIQKETI